MGMVFLGLDGEMSDSELALGAVLVQIGAAFSAEETFTSLIGYPVGSYYKTDKAMSVHGFSEEEIASAPPPEAVDDALLTFLLDGLTRRGESSQERRLVPVGFNVGAFDLPFVQKFLPKSAALMSRRVIDLNALCFAREYAGKLDVGVGSPKWSGWKRMARNYAAAQLTAAGVEPNWHDAGVDALGAMFMFDYLSRPQLVNTGPGW